MQPDEFSDNLRIRVDERDPILDKLDRAAAKSPPTSRRGSQRLAYRVEGIRVTITHPGGSVARCLVKGRNLSAGGMSFLYGGFLHHGTACTIILKTTGERPVVVEASVRSCRFVQQNIHEVGVQFREKLDPRLFCGPGTKVTSEDGDPVSQSPSLAGSVLLSELHELEERFLCQKLRSAGLVALTSASIGSALDLIRRLPFDVVILSDSRCEQPVAQMLHSIRAAGHRGVLAVLSNAITHSASDELEGSALCVCFPRPLDVDSLLRTLASSMLPPDPRPIFSDLVEETSPVVSYIKQSHSIALQLRDSVASQDMGAVRRICLQLRATAAGYGFGAISEVARQVEHLAGARSPGPDADRAAMFLAALLDQTRERRNRSAA